MIIKILNDVNIESKIMEFVEDVRVGLEKSNEVEVEIGEFYLAEISDIIDGYYPNNPFYGDTEEYAVLADHLIFKIKERLYDIRDISVEKVEDEDDTYIISEISQFRHEARKYAERDLKSPYICNILTCTEDKLEDEIAGKRLQKAYMEELGFEPAY